MKRNLCMALAAMLAMGTVPVSAKEVNFVQVPHSFTAKVGTTEFTKDGEAQPLDVAVYIKDSYTMLPMRTFLTAALENARMYWDESAKCATVLYGEHIITFDIKNNKIEKNGEELPVSGKMEIRDGRIFVPLRNWGTILQALGFTTEDNGITWDAVTQTATVRAAEQKLDISDNTEKPVLSGEGKAAVFTQELSTKYDSITSLGDGYFLAEKFVGETDVSLGLYIGGRENIRYLLDAKGNVLQTYDTGTDNYMRDAGEGLFLVSRRTAAGHDNGAIDREGNTVIPFIYRGVEPFSDGLAKVMGDERLEGFVNPKGEVVIPLQYDEANSFSEGLAGVEINDKWGFIDKTGKLVIDAKYKFATPFYEGLAMVRGDGGVGYIDKTGKEVIPCQYKWGGYFRNGVTYVTDKAGNTWLINTKGEQLKLIIPAAEGAYVGYANDDADDINERKNGILRAEVIVNLPNGSHEHLSAYYDETGEISYETYQMKKNLSEGLSPMYDTATKKYGYVDESGKWVITPAFDKAEAFVDGYAVVANDVTLANGEEDAEWGIIQHPNR